MVKRRASRKARMAKRNGRRTTAAAIRSVPAMRRASSRREARRARFWDVVILGKIWCEYVEQAASLGFVKRNILRCGLLRDSSKLRKQRQRARFAG